MAVRPATGGSNRGRNDPRFHLNARTNNVKVIVGVTTYY